MVNFRAGFCPLVCRKLQTKESRSFILTGSHRANCHVRLKMFFFVRETLCHIKNNTKCVWRSQLVEGPKFICRWCDLYHRKQTGVWVEKLVLAFHGCDIGLPNRSILPTDQMPHGFWCRFVPSGPAAHIRAWFLSLGLQGRMRWHHMAECCVPCWCAGTAHVLASRR